MIIHGAFDSSSYNPLNNGLYVAQPTNSSESHGPSNVIEYRPSTGKVYGLDDSSNLIAVITPPI